MESPMSNTRGKPGTSAICAKAGLSGENLGFSFEFQLMRLELNALFPAFLRFPIEIGFNVICDDRLER